MSTIQARALVLCGEGINCEQETAEAFRLAGFKADIRHIRDVIAEEMSLELLQSKYHVLVLPGGFSYGDDLSSGKVLALNIKYGLKWDLSKYAERGGLVLGVCNGFQVLIKLGLFGKDFSITHNESGQFLNTWVKVAPSRSRCVWLKGVGMMDLPIRHGEGRIVIQSLHKNEALIKAEKQGTLCLKYAEVNPNGSLESLAGLCDTTGRIFGLMPHPEAFVRWSSHPEWTMQVSRASAPGQGLAIFENALKEMKGSV